MWTCPNMNNVGLNYYMMKVFPSLDKVSFNCYVDIWSVKACGPMICLLCFCQVMGLHMYNALVDLDWGHE